MENFMLLIFLYAFFAGLIGLAVGIGSALNGNNLLTPKDIVIKIQEKDKIQIYHIFYIFGIPSLIIYYFVFIITATLIKIGTITIYKKKR